MVPQTRRAIIQAFDALIAATPFEDISMDDITQAAGVSRATFYRYFKDKYDVMNSNYADLLDRMIRLDECTSYRDLYLHLYNAGRMELAEIKGAFRTSGVNSFEYYIYQYSKQIVEDITKANRNGEGLTEQEDLQLDVFCYGISYMYKNWVLGRYPLSADQAADALFQMMPESLKYYWVTEA